MFSIGFKDELTPYSNAASPTGKPKDVPSGQLGHLISGFRARIGQDVGSDVIHQSLASAIAVEGILPSLIRSTNKAYMYIISVGIYPH